MTQHEPAHKTHEEKPCCHHDKTKSGEAERKEPALAGTVWNDPMDQFSVRATCYPPSQIEVNVIHDGIK